MKWMSVLILFIGATAFANGYCPSADMYEAEGWVVHKSEDFGKLESKLIATISAETAKGNVEPDLKGNMIVVDPDGKEIMLDVITLDNTQTDRDTMWGDYAIYTHHETQERVEIRWFDGKKNLVINSKYINCITGTPPPAENTLL
jgi:hypothetical protein